MKKICIFALIIGLLLSFLGCSGGNINQTSSKVEKLNVFAAASLTESFTEMADEYEKAENGKVAVVLNFAGSQALRTSIEAGAKADIFACADLKNMNELKNKKLINDYVIFAKNKLALIKNVKCKYNILSLADLGTEGLKLVVADSSVPVGAYWEKALDKGINDEEQKALIEKNIVSKELNVKDVLGKVLLNEADVGVVYRTDAAFADKDKISEIAVPVFDLLIAEYPVAVIKESKSSYAQKFIEWMLSEEGKKLFQKYGFMTE